MNDYLNSPELQTAQQAVGTAQTAYNTAATQDADLPTLLRKALMDKYTNNNPVLNDLNTASTNYQNVAQNPTAALPQGVILNPTQQETLINQKKNAALEPVAMLNMLMGLQTGGINNIIDAASQASTKDVTQKKGNMDAAQQAFQNLFALAQAKTGQANSDRQYNLDLTKLGLEYGPGIGGGQDMSKMSIQDQRKTTQQQFLNSGLAQQSKIAAAWKSAHGTELFPVPLNSTESTSVTNTTNMLKDINWLNNEIKSGKLDNYLGLMGGNLSNALYNEKTQSILPANVQKAQQILTRLRVNGERAGIGGRLTGYLLDKLSPAFPNLTQSKDQITNSLQQYYENGMNNLNTLSQNKSLDLTDLPGYSQVVRSQIVSSLKAAGKSDDFIHQYLRAKGIDK